MSRDPANDTIADAKQIGAALHQPDDERHLDAESELFPYVDGTADGATCELVELHVEDCDDCRREIEDLLVLRRQQEQASRRPRRRWLALAACFAAAIIALLAWSVWRPKPALPPESPIIAGPRPVPRRPAPQRGLPPSPAPERNREWQALVDQTLARGSLLVAPILRTVAIAGQTMRGPNGSSDAGMSPRGIVTETDQPKFSWTGVDGATYIVTIYENETEVANSGVLDRPSWTPPTLRRGRTYLWQIKVRKGEETTIVPAPPAPPTLFHVLGDAGVRELAAARAAHPQDHVLLAVLAARHGLVEDARHHLRRLTEAGRELPPDVQRLAAHELRR